MPNLKSHRRSTARAAQRLAEALEPRRLLSATMVGDVNAEPINSTALGNFTDAGGQFFFTADDLSHGTELWKSDGSAGGTTLVKDINFGPDASAPTSLFSAGGGVIYFTANDGVNGAELWRSDGTADGTYMLKDLRVGTLSSTPRSFVSVSGTTYFLAGSANGAPELWRTDGTAAGTVKIVKPTPNNAIGMVAMNNVLYMLLHMSSASSSTELWRSDGTAAGTSMVKSWPTSSGQVARDLTVFNNKLYFAASESATGEELWTSDGTGAGTVLVKDVRSGTSGSSIANFTVAGSRLFFAANNGANGLELWATDGTAGGTAMVKDIWSGSTGGVGTSFAAMNGILYFNATDPTNLTELWRSDGTSTGTTMVVNLNPSGGSGTASVTAIGNVLYFAAGSGAAGATGVWKSTGATGNATLVRGFGNNAGASKPNKFTGSGGIVFFTADDNDAPGIELWKTDGTAPGTSITRDIYPETESAAPFFAGNIGTTALFWADDGVHGTELWKTDGTPGTTSLVADLNPGAGDTDFNFERGVTIGGIMYFAANNVVDGPELWRTDGTAAGTFMISPQPGTGGLNPGKLFDFNGTLLLVGSALRRVDGSTVSIVKTFTSGPTHLAVQGNRLFFAASDAANGNELWSSDGTMAGTNVLKDIVAGTGSSSPTYLRAADNGIIYFFAKATGSDTELWKTNGTAAGTVMVVDALPTQNDFGSGGLCTAGGKLFFAGGQNSEPWVSDGTAPGTFLLKDIRTGGATSSPNGFIALGNTILFTANDDEHVKLWRSDGTPAGTVIVQDIGPDFESTVGDTNKFVIGDYAYFRASSNEIGTGLWRSDGTTAGTTMVSKVAGSIGFSMDYLVAGGKLYITADDDVHGIEVWSVTPDTSAPVVTDASFTRTVGGDQVTFQFDRDVKELPPYNNVWVYDVINQLLPTSRRVYDSATHRLVITFPTLAGGMLAEGFYRISLPAGGALTADNTPNAVANNMGIVIGSGANDTYNIQRNGDTITLGKTGTFTPMPLNWLSTVSVFGFDSNDSLTVNLTGGDVFPAGTLRFDGGAGADTLAIKGSGNVDVASFNNGGNVTLNSHAVSNIGVETLSYDGNGGNDVLTINSGNVILPASQHFDTLTIGDAASATVSAGGNKLIVTNALAITGTGRLDLTDHDLIVDYDASDPAPTIESYVANGFHNGDWLGAGVTSSTAASIDAAGAYTLGVVDNATSGITAFTTFSGQSVDSTTVLVKFTHRSDINLDGRVTFSDSVRFNGNFAEGTATRWMFGDLNYNGVSDFGDSVIFNGHYDESLEELNSTATGQGFGIKLNAAATATAPAPTPPPLPGLVVQDPALGKLPVFTTRKRAKGTLRVPFAFQGDGAAAVGPATIRLFLSTDSTLDAGDAVVSTPRTVKVKAPKPGKPATLPKSSTLNFAIPAGLEPNTYHLFAKIEGPGVSGGVSTILCGTINVSKK